MTQEATISKKGPERRWCGTSVAKRDGNIPLKRRSGICFGADDNHIDGTIEGGLEQNGDRSCQLILVQPIHRPARPGSWHATSRTPRQILIEIQGNKYS